MRERGSGLRPGGPTLGDRFRYSTGRGCRARLSADLRGGSDEHHDVVLRRGALHRVANRQGGQGCAGRYLGGANDDFTAGD